MMSRTNKNNVAICCQENTTKLNFHLHVIDDGEEEALLWRKLMQYKDIFILHYICLVLNTEGGGKSCITQLQGKKAAFYQK